MMPCYGARIPVILEMNPYYKVRNQGFRLEKYRGNPYIDDMLQSDLFPGASSNRLDGAIFPSKIPTAHQSQTLCDAVMVPIRTLSETDKGPIVTHLLALDNADRYLRFGHAVGDEHVGAYVESLNFSRDEIFGIFSRKLRLLALAHLAYPSGETGLDTVEFGVSVSKHARGRGYGTRLFERAAVHARNDGFAQMYIHALSENTAMLKIARDAGAVVQRDGSESDAVLRLPPANLDSRVSEIVQEQIAQADYRVKRQAQQFSRVIGSLRLDRG